MIHRDKQGFRFKNEHGEKIFLFDSQEVHKVSFVLHRATRRTAKVFPATRAYFDLEEVRAVSIAHSVQRACNFFWS